MNKIIKWGGAIFLTFFITATSARPVLKVAIIDTGFCPKLLKLTKNIKILTPIDLTKSTNINCKNPNFKNRRYHGQLLLEVFLRNLKTNTNIEITPLIVFDKNAISKTSYWKKAFTNQESFHLYITASSLILSKEQSFSHSLKTPLMAAGATVGRGINKSSRLWPQILKGTSKFTLIGSYLPASGSLGSREDYSLIRPKEMDFFFSSSKVNEFFKGSSRALAVAGAKVVNLCAPNLIQRKSLKECLQKNRILILLDETKTSVPSF